VVPDSLLHTGAAVCALTLLGFAGQANATPRPALDGASGLTILAQDEENAEVQNRVEPETDNGVPGGPTDATPNAVPEPVEVHKVEEPAKSGGDMEAKELKTQDR